VEPTLPVLESALVDAIPELLLYGSLDTFHLAVKTWSMRSDACMPDAEALEEKSELAAEFGAVVGLDAAGEKGKALRSSGKARQTAAVVRL